MLIKCPLFLQAKQLFFLKQLYLFLSFFILFSTLFAQQPDTTMKFKDSTQKILLPVKPPLEQLLNDNLYLNSKGTPVAQTAQVRNAVNNDLIFYLLAFFIFLFGIVRTVYSRYFSTLFRVFFNSSLRQSQLTDQLLQSKLPSLFYNLVFLISGGLYIYFLLQRINETRRPPDLGMLVLSIAAFTAVYLVKYLGLKFTGWVTGFKEEAETYIFIVFLINKIIGICLLPVIVIVAFSSPILVQIIVTVSLIFIGLMTLMRFLKSYSFLQNKLNVNRFHFFLYIFALEILPLIVMYRATELFIVKNL